MTDQRDEQMTRYESTVQSQQLQIQALQEQLRDARISSSPMPAEPSTESVSAVSATAKGDSWLTDAKGAGKKYAIMIQPYEPRVLQGPHPGNHVDPNHPDRYRSESSRTACALAEVWAVIPVHGTHAADLETGLNKWKKAFRDGMSDQRSSTVNRTKANGHFAFPEYPPSFFLDRSKRDTDEIKKLIGYNGMKYGLFFPLIYQGNNTEKGKFLFRNEGPMKIAKMILFGPSSLLENEVPTTKTTMGERWNVKGTTAGLIALSCNLTRFIFSTDPSFLSKGASTGIEYEKDFEDWKQYIITEGGKRYMQETINLWNQYLFRKVAAPIMEPQTRAEEIEDELEAQLARVSCDFSEDDGDEPTTATAPTIVSREPSPFPPQLSSTQQAETQPDPFHVESGEEIPVEVRAPQPLRRHETTLVGGRIVRPSHPPPVASTDDSELSDFEDGSAAVAAQAAASSAAQSRQAPEAESNPDPGKSANAAKKPREGARGRGARGARRGGRGGRKKKGTDRELHVEVINVGDVETDEDV